MVWAQAGRAGDAVHQPLRPGDHRGDHQGAGAGLPRARDGRLGPPLPHRHPGQGPAHRQSRSSGICSRRGRAAAPRRRATAGRRPASGRRPAASSSAASRCTEVRFPLFFRRHEFRPDCGGDGQLSRRARRRARDGDRDRPSPRVANTAGDGVRAWRLRPARRRGRRAAPLPAAVRAAAPTGRSRPRRSGIVIRPGDVFDVRIGRRRRLGRAEAERTRRRSARAATDELGFVTDRRRATEPCTASASMSAAPSPIWSRSMTPGRVTLAKARLDAGRPVARRDGRVSPPGRSARPRSRAPARATPSASSTARRSRPTRCSSTRAREVGLLTTEGHRDVIEMREGLKDDRYNLRLPPPEPLVPRAAPARRARADARRRPGRDRRSIARSLDAAIAALEEPGRRGGRGLLPARLSRCPRTSARPPRRVRAAHARRLRLARPRRCCRRSRSTSGSARRSSTPMSARRWQRYLARLASAAARGRLSRAGADHPVARRRGDRSPRPCAWRPAACSRARPAASPAAATAARLLGEHGNLIPFDMGGTSTDISLVVGGERRRSPSDRRVAGQRVALQSLDIASIGAGGGSIARVDDGGMLHVGPESAGAEPGPGLLRPGRRRGDGDRRQPGARLPRSRQLPRRRARARPRAPPKRAVDRDRRQARRRPHGRGRGHPSRHQHAHGRGHPPGLGAARRRSAALRAPRRSAAPPACTSPTSRASSTSAA